MDRLYSMNINRTLRNMVSCTWKHTCKLMHVSDSSKIYMYMIYKNEFTKILIDTLKLHFLLEKKPFYYRIWT